MKAFTSLLILFGLLALVLGNPIAEADALAEADAEADAFADLEGRQAPSRSSAKVKLAGAPAAGGAPVCTPCKVLKHNLKAYNNKQGKPPVIETHKKNTWVALQCFSTGKEVNGNYWWDKTVDGRWISEWYMDTPCVCEYCDCWIRETWVLTGGSNASGVLSAQNLTRAWSCQCARFSGVDGLLADLGNGCVFECGNFYGGYRVGARGGSLNKTDCAVTTDVSSAFRCEPCFHFLTETTMSMTKPNPQPY